MKQGHADCLCSRNLDLQRGARTAAGCERIFEDKASGVRKEYPPFGVNRATIDPLPGLGGNAKTRREAVSADR